MKRKYIAVLSVFATCLTWNATAGGPATASFEKADLPGVYNYTRMDGSSGFGGVRAGFGGETEPSALPLLKEEGYRTVINLRRSDEENADIEGSVAAAAAAGIRYVHLPFDSKNPDPVVIETFLKTVEDPANQPVYIHCASATRASALWMIGRVLKGGEDIESASVEVEAIAGKPDKAIVFATRWIEEHRP